jgi:cytochrome c-type biogenesis protein
VNAPDLAHVVVLPIGLGLLGFVEPCSIGSSLLFIKYIEGKDARTKISQAAIFTLMRAVFIGLLGVAAALVGAMFVGFQRAGWAALGALYVALGAAYLAGRAGGLMRTLGPSLGRLAGTRGAVALAVLFALNIPACATPLLAAILGVAAVGGASGLGAAAQGFVSLALFGLALSLPLALALLWAPTRRVLDRLAALSGRAPLLIGALLVALGVWSIALALFSTNGG